MTRSNIGGALDMTALGLMHFHSLDARQQAEAIRRMATGGQGEHTIAHATGLSVEFIRQVLANNSSRGMPGASVPPGGPAEPAAAGHLSP